MSGAVSPALLPDLAVGDLAALRAFLSGRGTRGTSLAAQLDARHDNEKQDTLLTWAARHGQAEAVRLLLEGGASVGATTGGGASALYIACQQGQIECARLLLEAGAAVNQARNDGTTPLIMACHNGHLEVAKLLSSYGASRAATPFGTPEAIVGREGHADLAAWLVASRGWTPLQHLEASPRLAAEGVSALSSRPLPLFRRRSPSTGRGRCCAAALTLPPASLLPSSGRASSARGASRIRPLRPSVPQSRSALSSRGRRSTARLASSSPQTLRRPASACAWRARPRHSH